MEENNQLSQSEKRERELASISYLWIFSVLILIGKRDNEFIQHHARRGVVLFVLSIVFWLVPMLHYGEFAVLALAIFGFISAAQGNENTIPILSEIADGTLRVKHLKHYWHHTKHGAIRMVKSDHVTPAIQAELKDQEKELSEQEKMLEKEKHMVEIEEKKLSSLYNRVNEDEKRIDELADEVHKLEGEMSGMKK